MVTLEDLDIMKILTVSEYKAIEREVRGLYDPELKRLFRREMTLDEYLRKSRELEDRLVDNSAIVTDDYSYFNVIYPLAFPAGSRETLRFLHEHREIALRHGLRPRAGLVVGCDIRDTAGYTPSLSTVLVTRIREKTHHMAYIIDGSTATPKENPDSKLKTPDDFLRYYREITSV